MAEGPSSSPLGDAALFIFLMLGLFILWLSTGGPTEPEEPVLIFNPTNDDERRGTGAAISAGERAASARELDEEIRDVRAELRKVERELEEARLRGTASPFEGMVTISGGRPRESSPDNEYLEIRASSGNDIDVPVTGWRLESVLTGRGGTILDGARIPIPGRGRETSTIFLAPGARAIVHTSRSPIGMSFLINKCTGYFEQFQDFKPRLRLQCPDPEDEFVAFSDIPVTHIKLDRSERDICQDYIADNVRRCEIHQADLDERDLNLSNECQRFIHTTYTYRGCLRNHEFDRNFLSNEWRVYLTRGSELWREDREIIRLLDKEGRTVDLFSY